MMEYGESTAWVCVCVCMRKLMASQDHRMNGQPLSNLTAFSKRKKEKKLFMDLFSTETIAAHPIERNTIENIPFLFY